MNSTNSTFLVEEGDTVCHYAHWIDIVRFLLFNYVLHVVTVLSSPGDGVILSTVNRIAALCVPLFGTVRALAAIHRCARGQKMPLQRALRSRALCMAVDWDPSTGDRVISPKVTTIQRVHQFEEGTLRQWVNGFYGRGQMRIPGTQNLKFEIAYNYNVVKILAAIAQILYSIFQLYQTSCVQIEKFGYAAYQLTIIPYMIMSLINLLASLCEPEFSAVFLVAQRVNVQSGQLAVAGVVGEVSMDCKARVHVPVGVIFEDTMAGVDRMCSEASVHGIRISQDRGVFEWLLLALCTLLAVVSIAGPHLIIWWLTGFKLGHSPWTVPVKVWWAGSFKFSWSTRPVYNVINAWVVVWIAYSQVASAFALLFHLDIFKRYRIFKNSGALLYGFAGLLVSLYGFVSVIKLMANDTVCVIV